MAFRDGREMLIAEDISLLPYTTEEAGGFVGCTIGMYASANGQDSSNYADLPGLCRMPYKMYCGQIVDVL